MIIDWPSVKLVIFDVDGTLYDQKPLRLKMAAALLRHCIAKGDFTPMLVLRAYRKWREEIAEQEIGGFENELVLKASKRFRMPEQRVREILFDWLEHRPLPFLASCRYAGVTEFFDAIRRSGRLIGILSDYPATAKLQALRLQADHVVSAGDDRVGMLKPNPRGLMHILDLAGVSPDAAIFIGDRAERDGEAGRRAGVRTYLRSSKDAVGWPCFGCYRDLAVPEGAAIAANH